MKELLKSSRAGSTSRLTGPLIRCSTHAYAPMYRRLTPVESSEMQALIFAADKLCSSTLMRCHDDGMTPTLFLGLIDEASQAGAAEGTISLEWGRQLYPATNPPFAAAFQTASELIKASIRYRVPSFLLLATYVARRGGLGLCAESQGGQTFTKTNATMAAD